MQDWQDGTAIDMPKASLPSLTIITVLILCFIPGMAGAQKDTSSPVDTKTIVVIVSDPASSKINSLIDNTVKILTDIIQRDDRFSISDQNNKIILSSNYSSFFEKNRDTLLQKSIDQVYHVSLYETNNKATAEINVLTVNNESVETFNLFKGPLAGESIKDITRILNEKFSLMPVQGLSAEGGMSTENIGLTWHHIPGRDTYNIFRAENERGPFERIGSTNSNSFMDTTAIPGREYFYSIPSTENADLPVDNSSIKRGYRKLSAPKPVASEEYLDKLVLTWDPVSGADNYQVHRYSHEKDEYALIATTKESLYSDRSIDRNTVCLYKVTAWAATGPGDASPMVSGKYTRTRDDMVMRGIVPGWGQFYRHDIFRGFLYSGLFTASSSALVWSAVNRSNKKKTYNTATSGFDEKWNDYKSSTYFLWGFSALTSLIYIANWVDILLYNDSLETSTDRNTTNMFFQNDKDIHFSVSMSNDKKADLFFLQIIRFI